MIEVASARGAELREALYAGRVLRSPPSEASRALVDAVREVVARELGHPIETAQHRMTPGEHFAGVTRARGALAVEARFLSMARAVAREGGFDPRELAVDPPRLRAVRDGGHRIAAAAPAYYAHRDTWYANPRSQINVWIPLHDVRAEETFVIYEDALSVPVENDSDAFEWDAFRHEVGFQRADPPPSATYPRALASLEAFTPTYVEGRAAELVLFSAAHLHEPRAHESGRTRFSVDFRLVHLGDHEAERGAPAVDVRCKGSTLSTYARGDG